MKKKDKINSNLDLHEIKNKKRVRPVKDKKRRITLKRVKTHRKAKAVASVLLVGVVGVSFAFMGGDPNLNSVPKDFLTVCSELPSDGSTPLEHTGLENIAYMNYRLKTQPYWYSHSHSDVSCEDDQVVDSYKQFSNGILIHTDTAIDKGIFGKHMIDNVQQFCWYLYDSNGPVTDFTEGYVMWNTLDWHIKDLLGDKVGDKIGLTEEDVLGGILNLDWEKLSKLGASFNHRTIEQFTYGCVEAGEVEPHKKEEVNGLPGTAFSVYVLRKETIESWDDVIEKPDGTYSQTFYLRVTPTPTAETDDSAVCHYRNQMVFKGGLDDLPSFKYVTITYTFDSTWQVLSSEIKEDYHAKSFGISASCSSVNTTVYSYDPALSYNPAYENYYQYMFDAPEVSKQPSPNDYLLTALAPIASEQTSLKLALDIDGYRLNGLFTLDLNMDPETMDLDPSQMNIRANFQNGVIRFYYIDNEAYLAYGGMKIKLSVDQLSALLGGSAEEPSSDDAETDGGFSLDSILSDLIGDRGLIFYDKDGKQVEVYNEEEIKSATFSTSLDLSFLISGLNISELNFYYNLDAGKVSLDYIDATIEFGGVTIGVNLSLPKDEAVPVMDDVEKEEFIEFAPYVESIVNLVQDDVLAVSVSYSNGGLDINGTFNLTFQNEFSLVGDLQVTYSSENNPVSKTLNFTYLDGAVYLKLDGLRVKVDVEQAMEIIGRFINFDELLNGVAGGFELNITEILEKVLSEEFTAVSITEANRQASVAIKVTQILELLGIGFDGLGGLDDTSLTISKEGSISLSALGATVTVTKGESNPFDTDGYVDIMDVALLVFDIIDKGALSLVGEVEFDVGDFSISLIIVNGAISWKNGFELYLDAYFGINGIQQEVILKATTTSLQFVYGDVFLDLTYSDLGKLDEAFVKLYNTISSTLDDMIVQGSPLPEIEKFSDLLTVLAGLIELGETFPSDLENIDIAEIINGIVISAPTSDDGICTISYNGIHFELIGSGEKVAIKLGYADTEFSVKVYLEANLSDTDTTIPEMPEDVIPFTAESFANLLDYLGAAVRTLAEPDISIDIWGETKTVNPEQTVTRVSGTVLYHRNAASNSLITIDLDGTTLTVAPDLYTDISLQIVSNSIGSSVYVDILVFDYDGNNELDFFVTLSMFEKGNADYKPLKIYAPAGEIMTVLSSGLMLFGIDDIAILNNYLVFDWLTMQTVEQLQAFGSMLTLSMQLDGDSLLEGILAMLKGAVGDKNDKVLKDTFIKAIVSGAEEFNVILNSASVYDIEGLENLSMSILKESGDNGKLRGFTMYNVYSSDGKEVTNVEIDFKTDKIDEASLNRNISISGTFKNNYYSGYYDFSSIGTLLKALANTATHTENGKQVINTNYYITGTIQANLFGSTAIAIQTAISVDLNKDNNGGVVIKARLNYAGYSILGLYSIINGKQNQLDLTLDLVNMMVYMERNTDGTIVDRAMPLSVFASDILGQFAFILNFSDDIASAMTADTTTTDSEEDTVVDYGEMIGAYLKAFSYDATKHVWSITLNGDGLTGGIIGDIVVTIGAEEEAANNNALALSSLGASMKLQLDSLVDGFFGNLLKVFSITIETGNNPLTIWNASEKGITDHDDDTVANLAEQFAETLGNIYNGEQWTLTDGEGRPTYFECSSSTVRFVLEGNELGTQKIFYTGSGSNFKLYTTLNYPELPEREGHSPVWSNLNPNTNTITASYVPNLYDVRFISAQKIGEWAYDQATGMYYYDTQMLYGSSIELFEGEGNLFASYTVSVNGNVFEIPAIENRDWLQADIYEDFARFTSYSAPDKVTYISAIDFTYDGVSYTSGYVKAFETNYTLFEADKISAEYTFLGWYIQTENGWIAVEEFTYSEGERVEYVVEALWQKTALSVNSVNYKRDSGFGSYTSNVTVNITDCELIGAWANDPSIAKHTEYHYSISLALGSPISGVSESNQFSVSNSFYVPTGATVTVVITYTTSDGRVLYTASAQGKS